MYWFINNPDRFRRYYLFMDTCNRAILYYLCHHNCQSYGNNYLYCNRNEFFRVQSFSQCNSVCQSVTNYIRGNKCCYMYWLIYNFDCYGRCYLFMDTCNGTVLYYMRQYYCQSDGNNYLYGYRNKFFRLQQFCGCHCFR